MMRSHRTASSSAGTRHWGRRDHDAIDAADADLASARSLLTHAEARMATSRSGVEREQQAAAQRADAIERTATEREALRRQVDELTHALDDTRPGRVLTAARGDGNAHMTAALGRAPTDPDQRVVWCATATEVEAWRDFSGPIDVSPRGANRADESLLGPRTPANCAAWDRLAALVADAPDLLDAAPTKLNRDTEATELPDFWDRALRSAVAAAAASRPNATVERDADLGLEW